jgi:hypothetical protein
VTNRNWMPEDIPHQRNGRERRLCSGRRCGVPSIDGVKGQAKRSDVLSQMIESLKRARRARDQQTSMRGNSMVRDEIEIKWRRVAEELRNIAQRVPRVLRATSFSGAQTNSKNPQGYVRASHQAHFSRCGMIPRE